jgi:hypothetical protein
VPTNVGRVVCEKSTDRRHVDAARLAALIDVAIETQV